MKKLFFAGLLLVSIPFMAGAHSDASATTKVAYDVTLKDAGFVPGDFFYFLDRWTEAINSFATFRVESKAKLALEHSQERASEVHSVLETKGVNSKEVKRAKDDFSKGLSMAAGVVASEKVKGVDVSTLAKELDSEFEISKDMLKFAFRARYDDLRIQVKDLRMKLNEAIKAGDVTAQATIEAELKKANEEASMVKDEEDLVDDAFDEEKNKLEHSMGNKHSAESHITNAERARVKFVSDITAHGIVTTKATTQVLASFDTMLASAKTAFAKGDFEIAKDNAKEARDILREFFKDEKESMEISHIEKDFFHDKKSEMREKMDGSEKHEELEDHEEAEKFFDSSTHVEVKVR